jgi:hypothetical protein
VKGSTLKNAPLVEAIFETQPDLNLSYRNPEAAKEYLADHPEIEKFIEAARPTLNQFFGTPLEIILELVIYPDETASEELVGWIQQTGDVDECLIRFEQFEDEWFLDHMDQVGDKFNFNIEIK